MYWVLKLTKRCNYIFITKDFGGKKEPRGVLSVLGDDDYLYGMPLNHYYCEEDGKIYFHGGKSGHKIDSKKNIIRHLSVYTIRAFVMMENGQ